MSDNDFELRLVNLENMARELVRGVESLRKAYDEQARDTASAEITIAPPLRRRKACA